MIGRAGLAAVMLAGCSAPVDGVLSLTFLLETPPPADGRVVPPEAETGVDPAAYGAAIGTCVLTPPTRTILCTFEKLPPLPFLPPLPAGATGARRYDLSFLLAAGPVGAGTNALGVDRNPGGQDPDRPQDTQPHLPRERLGPVLPDPFGAGRIELAPVSLPLDHVIGGELGAVVPRADGSDRRYVVIDGRLGNLRDTGGGAAPSPSPPGHRH